MNTASLLHAILQALIALPVPAMVLFKMTILLGLGWILHFALIRSNPRWRVLLWRMLMVGLFLLIPAQLFLPELSLFVINEAQKISAPANPVPAPLPAAPLDLQTPAEPLAQPDNNLPPIPQKTQISLAAFLESLMRNWPALLAITWAAFALIFSIRHLYTYSRLSQFIKSANPAPENILATAKQVALQLERVELPRLRVADDLASPFAAGFLRPVIVIPKTLADEKYRPNLVAVLAHELVHIKSRDLFWMAFAHALSILLWFHPLMWRMRHAHNMACEQVCDGVAAEISGGAPAYSQTLAQTFLTLVVDAPQPMGAPMLRPSEIMRRIAILKIGLQVRALRRSWVGLSCLAAIIVLAGLGGLRLAKAKEIRPEKEKASQSANPAAATSIKKSGIAVSNTLPARTYEPSGNTQVGDIDKLSPERRYAFLNVKLHDFQISGNWRGMLELRNRLMRIDDSDSKDTKHQPLIDADILYKVASYFDNTVFFPPDAKLDMSSSFVFEYWKSHYRDLAEAERINQYIVDHFDLNYAPVANALSTLASIQSSRNNRIKAIENYKRFQNLDLNALYETDVYDNGSRKIVKAADRLKDDMINLKKLKEMLPGLIASASAGLPLPIGSIAGTGKQSPTDEKTSQGAYDERKARK